MNKVILCGRLTKPPTVYANGDSKSAKYTLAVDRAYKREGGQEADFINCTAFGKIADFAEKYLQQGTKILVEGRIQTGSYTNKEGQKVYTTEVVVSNHEFVESKRNQATGQTSAPPPMQSAPVPQYQAQAPQMPPQQQQYQAPPQQYQQPYQQQYQQQMPPQYQQQAPQQVTGQEQWQIPQDGAGEELPFI